MSNNPRFDYGDLVRLKGNPRDSILKSGDYGIVWAIYSSCVNGDDESLLEFDYEGTFWNKEEKSEDLWFEKNDVEKVSETEDIDFPSDMKKLWNYLTKNTETKE